MKSRGLLDALEILESMPEEAFQDIKEPRTPQTVADALAHLDSAKSDYTRLVENNIYDIGLYRPDGDDRQVPHKRDEAYVIGSGTGKFRCGGQTKAFGPGDMFFVPAGAEHRFLKLSEDFAAWVIFFGPRSPK